jgi:hypothetical protein
MDMMQADKSAPPAKIAVALLLIVTIVGAIVFSLSTLTDEIEEHYHIFHPQAKKVDDHGKSGSNLIFLIALYPILSVIGLLLVIPLLIVTHSPGSTSLRKLTCATASAPQTSSGMSSSSSGW